VEEYSVALNVDSDLGKSGKIHAVIRCNRAAGYMALRRFREAARDCTAALNIAPDYRKGLLRRARCHARLKLYKESLADYESWVAGEIGAGGRSDEIDSVKKELEEVRKVSPSEAAGEAAYQGGGSMMTYKTELLETIMRVAGSATSAMRKPQSRKRVRNDEA
jgi:hypothetical protein